MLARMKHWGDTVGVTGFILIHIHVQSFRFYPSSVDVIEWLGAYFIETQFCEKAIQYFERAALIQ